MWMKGLMNFQDVIKNNNEFFKEEMKRWIWLWSPLTALWRASASSTGEWLEGAIREAMDNLMSSTAD